MIKMNRKPAPDWLLKKSELWGKEFEQSNKKFRWRFGPKKYTQLLSILLSSTFNHCAYCDNYPMGGRRIKPEIDHFKPKSIFKQLAYQWENLFVACRYCQERINEYDDLLLKPDESTYSFKKYFEYDDLTCEIKPNRKASKLEKNRALYTIKIFKLNGDEKNKDVKNDYPFL